MAVIVCYQLRLPEPVIATLLSGVSVYLIIAVGLTIVRATAMIVDTLDAFSAKYAEDKTWFDYYLRLKPLVPTFRRCLEYGLWIGVGSLVLAQLAPISALAAYGPGLMKAIGVFFIGRVVVEIGHLVIDRAAVANTSLDDVSAAAIETIVPLIKKPSSVRSLTLWSQCLRWLR